MLLSSFSFLSLAALVPSIQGVLSQPPPTGNIPYTLPNERTFLLNVPQNYDSGVKHPLVLSFHGAGGSAGHQQRITELSDPSLTIAGRPFITVYAQAINNTAPYRNRAWEGAPYANPDVDDIAYVYDVISTITTTYNVDRARIYACGKSNGGGFTALLACRNDTSSLFAAFAPVSPALYQGVFGFYGCSPSRPVPILHSHGTEDQECPFYGRAPGNESYNFGPEPDVRLWRRQWAERNGCKGTYPGGWPEPSVEKIHPGVESYPGDGAWEEVWDCGENGEAEVRAITVDGLGHAWPSTLGLDHAGSPNQTASFNFTSQHLVEFFSKHTLPL